MNLANLLLHEHEASQRALTRRDLRKRVWERDLRSLDHLTTMRSKSKDRGRNLCALTTSLRPNALNSVIAFRGSVSTSALLAESSRQDDHPFDL